MPARKKAKSKLTKSEVGRIIQQVEKGWDLSDSDLSPEDRAFVEAALREAAPVNTDMVLAQAKGALREAVQDRQWGSVVKIIHQLTSLVKPKPIRLKPDLSSIEGISATRAKIADMVAQRKISPGEAQTLILACASQESAFRQRKEEAAAEILPLPDELTARARIEAILNRIKGRNANVVKS